MQQGPNPLDDYASRYWSARNLFAKGFYNEDPARSIVQRVVGARLIGEMIPYGKKKERACAACRDHDR